MNYFFEATDGSGQTVLGKIDAESLTEAHRLLVERGYQPQSVAPNSAPLRTSFGEGVAQMGATQVASAQREFIENRTIVAASAPGQLVQSSRSNQFEVNANSSSNELALNANSPVSVLGSPLDLGPVTRYTRPAPPLGVSDRSGASSQDLLLFFQQLAPLVKSGMTIYTALDNLAKRTRNKAIADIAHEMAETARKGGRITDVMARYPRIFPEHVVGTIRAGELGGFMEIVLGEVAINYEQNIALYRGSWKWKALVYQACLTLALVLPLFGSLFNTLDIGANLHLYLRREMIILPVFGALYLLSLFAARRVQEPRMKRWRDGMSLKIPAIGDLQRQAALSAFVRMLRKLYNAGVGPIHAWEAAMNTADNSVIRDKLAASYAHIQRGGSLADAFAATGLFADNVEQIIVTGQLSGEVTESLDQAASIYQGRVQDAHDRARSMMFRMARTAALVIGAVAFLWMVYTYFGAMFHLAGQFEDP